jgi:hypothetical protein
MVRLRRNHVERLRRNQVERLLAAMTPAGAIWCNIHVQYHVYM